MSKLIRLNGIDLCRGLAAFAVILVHSGDETWGLPISETAIRFRHLFYFAVPFFLAASFYFGTRKLPLTIDGHFWRKKFKRIVLPYLLWSLFYVVTKTIIYSLTNKPEDVQELLADPVALIFLGAASYHLYFIPLLLSGLLLLYLANYLSKPNNHLVLAVFTIFSLITYQLLINSQSDFNIDTFTAFPQLLQLTTVDSIFYQPNRIVLMYLSWAVRCLPYFAIALALNQILKRDIGRWLYSRSTVLFLLVICVLANAFAEQYLPRAVSEIIIAYSLLLFGISISKYLPESKVITNLGACSFGIYLLHPFIKSAVDIFLIKVVPQVSQSVSILSILTYSSISFFASWIVIALMKKNKAIAQYI
jgi:peptidoglycan/LPS O-acetylase OafA/YrhL